jgi:putative tricarboxylic transport membrane protein
LIFLLFATNGLIKVVKIPNRFLGVAILTLSFVGVYSLRNSLTDCVIAAAFGVFGFVLKRLSLPAVPIILGMVLGHIMEVKLRAGMARVKSFGDFFIDRHGDTTELRPVAVILFLMIVGVLALHIRTVLAERRTLKEAKWLAKKESTRFAMQMLRRKNYLSAERGKRVKESRSRYVPRSTDKS